MPFKRLAVLIFVSGSLLYAQSPGQRYAVARSVLRQLSVSSGSGELLRSSGKPMSDVRMPVLLRQHLLTELAGPDLEDNDVPDVLSQTILSLYRIGPGLAPVLRLDGGGAACGATGNCTILFFDTKTGAVVLDGNGWKVIKLEPVHDGAHDLAILHNMSACSGVRDEYRFHRNRYRMIAERDTKNCP